MAERALRFSAGAAAIVLALWIWTGTAPPLGAPPARRGDCTIIKIWSNGFHTNISMPTALLAPGHPLRRLDPTARYILLGWGDEAFFRSDGTNLLLGLAALLPGGPVTMHVLFGDRPVEEFYRGEEALPVAISREGAAALGRRLGQALQLDPHGRVEVIAPGHYGPRSWFLKARGEFDLFQVCNQWTARALRAAGVNLNAAFLYTGSMVIWALRDVPHACPAPAAD